MDRTAFAACAGLLLPLAALNLGCGAGSSQRASAPRSEPAPRMLELQARAPGPWRRLDAASTAPVTDAVDLPGSVTGDPLQPSAAPSEPVEASPVEDSQEPPAPLAVEPANDAATSRVPAATRQAQFSQAAPRTRTPEMVAALRQADERVRTGFGRAERGAHFSARSDFLAALKLIARAKDAQQSTRIQVQSLNSGLAALKESSSFARLAADTSPAELRRFVALHETKILKDTTDESMTPATAAQRYREQARAQLALVAGGESAGSMALFGLAKVALVVGRSAPAGPQDYSLQAVTLYEAALTADPKNFCAANELGVLLAEIGRLEPARGMLIKSVSISPQAATWHNLAVVHARLGETQLSQQAQAQADALPNRGVSKSGPNVQWVDPATFAQVTKPADGLLPAVPATVAAPGGPAARPAVNVAKKKEPNESIPGNSRR